MQTAIVVMCQRCKQQPIRLELVDSKRRYEGRCTCGERVRVKPEQVRSVDRTALKCGYRL